MAEGGESPKCSPYLPIRRFVDGDASDGVIPGRIKGLAALSLVVWTAVITTGRLIAYVG